MKPPENVVKVNKIAFQNVVRQRLSFHYSEMEEHLDGRCLYLIHYSD